MAQTPRADTGDRANAVRFLMMCCESRLAANVRWRVEASDDGDVELTLRVGDHHGSFVAERELFLNFAGDRARIAQQMESGFERACSYIRPPVAR